MDPGLKCRLNHGKVIWQYYGWRHSQDLWTNQSTSIHRRQISLHRQARSTSQFIAQQRLRKKSTSRVLIWTITQHLHQTTKLQTTPSVKHLCQRDPQRGTMTATGAASSSGRPGAMRGPLYTFDDAANISKLQSEEILPIFRFPLNVAMWSRFYERLLMGFILVYKGSRTKDFDTVPATTSENIDRSQRRIQRANIAGLERISMVKNYVVE